MTNTVILKVAMMCTGCSGAVERVLGKMEGVQSFDVNLETQKVTVVGTVTHEGWWRRSQRQGRLSSHGRTETRVILAVNAGEDPVGAGDARIAGALA